MTVNQEEVKKNIESLLFKYTQYKSEIKKLEKRIESLQAGEEMISVKYDSENVQYSKLFKSEIDKRMEKINYCTKEMLKYECIIDTLDRNLENIKKEKYFKIIPMIYFEKKTLEDIAQILNIDVSTVKRNKKKLINNLKLNMLPLYI